MTVPWRTWSWCLPTLFLGSLLVSGANQAYGQGQAEVDPQPTCPRGPYPEPTGAPPESLIACDEEHQDRRVLFRVIAEASLREIGVEVTPDFGEAAAVFAADRLDAGNWDLFNFAWVGSPDPASNVELWKSESLEHYGRVEWQSRTATRSGQAPNQNVFSQGSIGEKLKQIRLGGGLQLRLPSAVWRQANRHSTTPGVSYTPRIGLEWIRRARRFSFFGPLNNNPLNSNVRMTDDLFSLSFGNRVEFPIMWNDLRAEDPPPLVVWIDGAVAPALRIFDGIDLINPQVSTSGSDLTYTADLKVGFDYRLGDQVSVGLHGGVSHIGRTLRYRPAGAVSNQLATFRSGSSSSYYAGVHLTVDFVSESPLGGR